MKGAHWLCNNEQHDQCIGKRLKSGVGPVKLIPCRCKCHQEKK